MPAKCFAIVFFIAVSFGSGALAHAAGCPPGSDRIGMEVKNGVQYIHCRCQPGKAPSDGACVDVSPLSDRDVGVWSGRAFKLGNTLRQRIVENKAWIAPVNARLLQAIHDAERGFYDRAAKMLKAVQGHLLSDALVNQCRERIKKLSESLAAITGRPNSSLLTDSFQADAPKSRSKRAQALGLLGLAHASVGDYDKAVDSLAKALAENPKDEQLQQAMMFTSRVRANQRVQKTLATSSGTPSDLTRNRAKASAIVKLGVHYAENGQGWRAVTHLLEAKQLYGNVLDQKIVTSLINNVHAIKPIFLLPNYATKAEAIFDALDYGKGNWDDSLNYLKLAIEADPQNFMVRDAFNYLEGLRTGLGS